MNNISERLRQKNEQRALDLFEKGHLNDDIINIDIRGDILKKLHPHQILHTFNMITSVKNNKVSLDASYMGTGKTYTTAAVCAQLKLIVFVLCPKSIINMWNNILKFFNVPCI